MAQSYKKLLEMAQKCTAADTEGQAIFFNDLAESEECRIGTKKDNIRKAYCTATGASLTAFNEDLEQAIEVRKKGLGSAGRKNARFWNVPDTMLDENDYIRVFREAGDGHILCKRFDAIAIVQDTEENVIGIRIHTPTRGDMTVSIADIHGSKSDLAVVLTSKFGLAATGNSKFYNELVEIFVHYLRDETLPVWIEAKTPGWINDGMWIGANGKVVGIDPEERVIFLNAQSGYRRQAPEGAGAVQKEKAVYAAICEAGSPDAWKFAYLLGLASAAQGVIGCRNYGLFWSGFSKHGKTTAQRVQVAIAGPPSVQGGLFSIGGTTNGLEIPLKNASGSPVALDEAGRMADPGALPAYTFNLMEGEGKVRADKTATRNREQHTWAVLPTISCERTPLQMVAEGRKALVAGLINRCPAINISDVCPNTPENAELAKRIERDLRDNNGHILSEYVEKALLGYDRGAAYQEWRGLCEALATGAPPGLRDATELFALCWWAGRQAARVGITVGLTDDMVEACVRAVWNSFVGGEMAAKLNPGETEIHKISNAVKTEWNTAFLHVGATKTDENARTNHETWGYYMLPDELDALPGWKAKYPNGAVFVLTTAMDKITGGSTAATDIAKKLKRDGLLITHNNQNIVTHVPLVGRMACYAVSFEHFAPDHAKPPVKDRLAGGADVPEADAPTETNVVSVATWTSARDKLRGSN